MPIYFSWSSLFSFNVIIRIHTAMFSMILHFIFSMTFPTHFSFRRILSQETIFQSSSWLNSNITSFKTFLRTTFFYLWKPTDCVLSHENYSMYQISVLLLTHISLFFFSDNKTPTFFYEIIFPSSFYLLQVDLILFPTQDKWSRLGQVKGNFSFFYHDWFMVDHIIQSKTMRLSRIVAQSTERAIQNCRFWLPSYHSRISENETNSAETRVEWWSNILSTDSFELLKPIELGLQLFELFIFFICNLLRSSTICNITWNIQTIIAHIFFT